MFEDPFYNRRFLLHSSFLTYEYYKWATPSLDLDHSKIFDSGVIKYCEKYIHCGNSPCVNPIVNFQKDHDLDLKTARDENRYLLVQYRSPIESLISFFILFCGLKKFSKTYDNWKKFALEYIIFWKRWIRKWVIEVRKNFKNCHFVDHTALVADPISELSKIIMFIDGNQADLDLLKSIVEIVGVSRRNDIDFKFYNIEFMTSLERSVKDEIIEAGLRFV